MTTFVNREFLEQYSDTIKKFLYSLLKEFGFVENPDNNFEITVTEKNKDEVQKVFDFLCDLFNQPYRELVVNGITSVDFRKSVHDSDFHGYIDSNVIIEDGQEVPLRYNGEIVGHVVLKREDDGRISATGKIDDEIVKKLNQSDLFSYGKKGEK